MLETNQRHSFSDWLRRSAVWLTLIPMLLSMWVIFGFSAQSAEQSTRTSSRVVDEVIRLFVPDYSELSESRQTELADRITIVVRKMAHALEYAMFGFFLHLHVWAWRQWVRRLVRRGKPASRRFRLPWWIWTLLIGCLYAVTDEIHQGFVADRAPRVTDVVIDAAGLAAGMAVCALVILVVTRIRQRKGKHTA